MKTRRMVSKLIYDSERFLKMSVSARDLYTYLILHADDDGVVEAGTVLRLTKGADDDLNLLIYKNFITMLNLQQVTNTERRQYIRLLVQKMNIA